VDLKGLVDNAQKLPNIPKVVQELIETFGDDTVNSDDIAQKISVDQVLIAKVLRAANSAYYGGNRNVSSVSNAVFILGFNAVRTLVLASGITGAFKAPENFDLPKFWRDSFAVASTCKWVARFSNDDAETAFTTGMMHNIGELLIHLLIPEACKEIHKLISSGVPRFEAEKKVLGFNFSEAGAELAYRWKFPEAMVIGIRDQLGPLATPEFSRLAAIIHIASQMVHANQQGDAEGLVANFPHDVAVKLGINVKKMIGIIEDTQDLLGGFDELFN